VDAGLHAGLLCVCKRPPNHTGATGPSHRWSSTGFKRRVRNVRRLQLVFWMEIYERHSSSTCTTPVPTGFYALILRIIS
jgi:hypothetical protein